jgi:hypothetical protein
VKEQSRGVIVFAAVTEHDPVTLAGFPPCPVSRHPIVVVALGTVTPVKSVHPAAANVPPMLTAEEDRPVPVHELMRIGVLSLNPKPGDPPEKVESVAVVASAFPFL